MYPLGALRAIANGRLMLLDSTELGRLAMIHKYPQLYIERRTETMAVNFPFYRMTVLQQFTLPMNDYPDDGVPRQVYVPLGDFSKHRLPDLTVTGPDGSLLPVLTRTERAQVLASLFSASWQAE